MKRISILFTLLVLTVACRKEGTQDTPAHPEIYVVGNERVGTASEGPTYAMLWHNGKPQQLTDGTCYAVAYCTCVEKGHIYAGGAEMQDFDIEGPVFARIWKDGEPLLKEEHTPSSILAISVCGSDVYAAGNMAGENSMDVPVLWKNGQPTLLDYTGYDGGQAYCMKIVGTDIYIGGCLMNRDQQGQSSKMPCIWKNGVLRTMWEWDVKLAFVLGIDVSASGDVHACGYVAGQGIYWKNDDEPITLAAQGNTSSLFISGSDVYVTGYEQGESGWVIGRMWKNGTVFQTMEAASYNITLNASAPYGEDIYTIGDVLDSATGKAVATIWKNGQPTTLNSDGKAGEANSILIK